MQKSYILRHCTSTSERTDSVQCVRLQLAPKSVSLRQAPSLPPVFISAASFSLGPVCRSKIPSGRTMKMSQSSSPFSTEYEQQILQSSVLPIECRFIVHVQICSLLLCLLIVLCNLRQVICSIRSQINQHKTNSNQSLGSYNQYYVGWD